MNLQALALALGLALSDQASAAGPPVAILDAKELAALEARGAHVGRMAFDLLESETNADLVASRGYRQLVDTLGADLRDLYGDDKAWGAGMRFTHRGFDLAWLTSPDARWELVAVMNRVDRKAFEGECGELRFIYRLAYTTQTKSGPFTSRLPATLNVVYVMRNDGEGCAKAARVLEGLHEGALPPPAPAVKLRQVEVDLQTSRWPSTVRPDLGGHAEYVLRVFWKKGVTLVPAPLENTPDVEAIARDPARKAALLEGVKGAIQRIDQGTVVVRPEDLAERAVSVTPRGLARPQNRPWSRLFKPEDFRDVDFSKTRSFQDAPGLLRRLDGLTCMGCHQSASVAGFHIVGEDREVRPGDSLAVAVSPHVEDELARRTKYVEALVARAPVDDFRPPAEHGTGRGGFGDACGLVPSFSSWTCAQGFTCTAVDDGEVGQCLPKEPVIGGACKPGDVDFKKDRIWKTSETACPSLAVCEDVDVGFPGGMCAGACTSTESMDAAHAGCGGIALLTPFNECLARGELFSTCAQHARPAALRRCGTGDPCRPDYLCARGDGGGVCLPPYFVLQMRVDGHPKPKKKTK